MDTAYKRNGNRKKLREEAEKLKILPEMQAGFRKKRMY